MMLKIKIPILNNQEIKYSLDVLIGELLGLEYTYIEEENRKDVNLWFGDSVIELSNSFFQESDFENLYSAERIPKKIESSTYNIGERFFPYTCLYGEPVISMDKTNCRMNIDLIGSTFFMLSRWEEAIVDERDNHNRFDDLSSLAFKNNFHQRPIVNEYAELLWAILKEHGLKQNRKKFEFSHVPTHDIDHPLKWWNTGQKVRTILSDLKQLNYKSFRKHFNKIISGEDLFDKYDLFMDLAEAKYGNATFYFMTGGTHKYDPRARLDDSRLKNIIQHINERGHQLGLHPSYESCNNAEMIEGEKIKLEKLANREITKTRQHYLRVNTPATWSILDKLNFTEDSSMGFAKIIGFRHGVCHPFPLYNFKTRKRLNIIENPLLIMDASLVNYLKLSDEDAIIEIAKIKTEVQKYSGNFNFLWHNSSFDVDNYIGRENLLEYFYS